MSRSFFFGSVEASALENNINIELAPRKISCVLLCVDFDGLAFNRDGVLTSAYRISVLIFALGRIVLQKMCKHFRAREIVDRNNIITLCIEHLSECKTTNTSKTVNSYFYCHLKNTP